MDAVPELQRSNTASSLEKRKAYSADIDEEKVMVMEASSVDEVGSDVKVIEKAEDVAIEVSFEHAYWGSVVDARCIDSDDRGPPRAAGLDFPDSIPRCWT